MSYQRMATKVAGCLAYDHQERYRPKYPGMRSFLVATVTQTRERAEVRSCVTCTDTLAY
jgi:hypothetical protein